MSGSADGVDAATEIEAHHQRLVDFVNIETLNLMLSMTTLVRRLRSGGLSPLERQHDDIRQALEWAQDAGIDRVREHMVVNLWAALEVYAEQLFVVLCRVTDISDHPQLGQVSVRLAHFAKLNEGERYRVLWERAGRQPSGVDRYDELLGYLGISVDVEALRGDYPLPLFEQGATLSNAWVRRCLRELAEVRNVILHAGRIVDARLAKASAGRYDVGDPLALAQERTGDYGLAVLAYADAARYAAYERVAPAWVVDGAFKEGARP